MKKTLLAALQLLPMILAAAEMGHSLKANELVQFLSGKWDNVSFEIADGKPIKREAYPETMVIKDPHTLTITAHGFRDGKDLT
jgi:hypothetical protein